MVLSTAVETKKRLTLGVVGLVLPNDHIFLQCLHRKHISVIFLSHQVDFAERASADNFDDLEVFDGDVSAGVVRVIAENALRDH